LAVTTDAALRVRRRQLIEALITTMDAPGAANDVVDMMIAAGIAGDHRRHHRLPRWEDVLFQQLIPKHTAALDKPRSTVTTAFDTLLSRMLLGDDGDPHVAPLLAAIGTVEYADDEGVRTRQQRLQTALVRSMVTKRKDPAVQWGRVTSLLLHAFLVTLSVPSDPGYVAWSESMLQCSEADHIDAQQMKELEDASLQWLMSDDASIDTNTRQQRLVDMLVTTIVFVEEEVDELPISFGHEDKETSSTQVGSTPTASQSTFALSNPSDVQSPPSAAPPSIPETSKQSQIQSMMPQGPIPSSSSFTLTSPLSRFAKILVTQPESITVFA
jgi:hypothetical protein